MLTRIFIQHPANLGETYTQHQRAAFFYGFSLLGACLAALVHGLLPCLCETTASRTVTRLHAHMMARRAVPAPAQAKGREALLF